MQQSPTSNNAPVTHQGTRSEKLVKLRQLVDRIQVCMVNTNGLDGFIHSRPMAYLHMEPEGDLQFFTRSDSAKVEEIERDSRVSVTFSDPSSNLYVTVRGHARLTRDLTMVARFFNSGMERWFPGGASDAGLRIFTVTPDAAEYWEGPAGLTLMLDVAKATLTGAKRDAGEHASLTL